MKRNRSTITTITDNDEIVDDSFRPAKKSKHPSNAFPDDDIDAIELGFKKSSTKQQQSQKNKTTSGSLFTKESRDIHGLRYPPLQLEPIPKTTKKDQLTVDTEPWITPRRVGKPPLPP